MVGFGSSRGKAKNNQLADILRTAVEINNVQALKHAIRMGANLNHEFRNGYTVLHIAVERGSNDVLKYLCAMDHIAIDAHTHLLMTPLSIAVQENKLVAAQILMGYGADPNTPIVFEQNVVHVAAHNQNHTMLHEVITNGAEVNIIDCFDQSPLSISILMVPNRRITRILLEAGADPNFKSKSNMSILTEAILTENVFHHFKVIRTLIEYGANVNDVDEIKRETPLHKAAAVGNATILIYLIERGANLLSVNVYGQTPLDVARMHGHERCTEILTFLEENAIEEELRMLEAKHGRELPDK
ncbi:hypothetical protein GE061_016081 [Apolygus lucorum]|uniref:Uncharacterized protein n=1 Tax=Apolygus lucorum TaxID=248454 RepID=A0A8S9XGD7_APOLU|nr:hypothetical protein GE061_016081 [Apolygus lucorum]